MMNYWEPYENIRKTKIRERVGGGILLRLEPCQKGTDTTTVQ
jgi:hypothetical protein